MQLDNGYFILIISLAAICGALCSWLWFVFQQNKQYIAIRTLEKDYVRREVYEQLQREADMQYENFKEISQVEKQTATQLASTQTELQFLRKELDNQHLEIKRIQQAGLAQFEQVADRLLQEKSKRFADQNAERLGNLLQPLQARISGFEAQIERKFIEETKDRISLREEIKHLQQLNAQISTEANNLAGALRGNSKVQGDWGEWQLVTLLEAGGLKEGVHFRTQSSFRDDEGRQKRPDIIINLPEDKNLVIDAKVSLNAYESYCSLEPEDPTKSIHERSHVQSLRRHVSDLSSKNYNRLHQINSPDYILLFVPIEPALGLALSIDQNLFLEALEKNIVLVGPSTLLATMRTVSFIWKQENQKKNVLEIARQSGLLYDKFVAFTHELQKVGLKLEQAQQLHESAMRKLYTGSRKGATLIGRAEKLRNLGARTNKKLPHELLQQWEEE